MTNAAAAPLLEIRDLSISYFTRAGEVPAVVDFSLAVKAGESVGLVGESGCGKSTVALAIMRYLGSNGGIVGGSIEFRGRDMVHLSEEELRSLRGSEIAMIYQEPMAALNPSLTVASQLTEGLLVHEKVTQAEARTRAIKLLSDVHVPDPERIMAAYPHQLSGGQQQRVVIAMALSSNPSLLLLDEPTTALDVTVQAGIVALIAEISKSYETALLYISHNLGLILEVCDRVCVMYSGEVVEEGSVEAVFAKPRHPYTHGLFACIPLPSADKHARPLVPIPGQLPLPHERPKGCNFGPRCGFFKPGLCDARDIAMEPVRSDDDPNHQVRCIRWNEIDPDRAVVKGIGRPPVEVGETVLEVDNMKKYYVVRDRSIGALISGRGVRYVKANEAISFSAKRGQTVGIVGESGCGKSTFAKVLMGLETATAGKIEFEGKNIAGIPIEKRGPELIRALQMVFQDPDGTLNPSHSVGWAIGRVIRKVGQEKRSKVIRKMVGDVLELVRLPREFTTRKPRQLSGGQKQRVAVARAFAGNPALVVADEPVSSLDVSVQAAVINLLMEVQEKYNTTLLFISHDLSAVRYLADRVVVMYLGRIMESGSTDEVFGPPYHPYTEALLSAVPVADPGIEKRHIVLEGVPPSALDPPKGCPFCTRCPRKLGPICDDTPPPVHKTASGHAIACHIPLAELEKVEPVFVTAAAD